MYRKISYVLTDCHQKSKLIKNWKFKLLILHSKNQFHNEGLT